MSFIHGVETALPEVRESKSAVREICADWLGADSPEFGLFARLHAGSKIEARNFAVPLPRILELEGSARRAAIFEETGRRLGTEALGAALGASALEPRDLGALVFVSCSAPAIPSIDAEIALGLGCSPNLVRVPVYQYGCAGGSAGLALANRLAAGCGTAAVLSVELCSLVFHRADRSPAGILGAALFGDGAGCAVLSMKPGPLEISDSRSVLIPGTAALMGYTQYDDGPRLRLEKELPGAVARAAPEAIGSFLASHELHHSEIDFWLFHPGGVKVLSALEQEFGLRREQSKWAWDTLAEFGNTSSASVLFVLRRFLREHPFTAGQRALLVGIGPGLSLELSLIDCR